MNKPPRSASQKMFLRLGFMLAVAALLVLLQAAWAPQPGVLAGGGPLNAPALVPTSPGPTEVPNRCGGFWASVRFRGFDVKANGRVKPVFSVNVHDDRDLDCDGIPDTHDNCLYTPNHDQAKSNPNVSWGDACQPENGYRLTRRDSEVVIYQMSNTTLHFYSPEGQKLGEASSAGLIKIDPSLTLQQVAGRTFMVGFTDANGQKRSTRFESGSLIFTMTDVSLVEVAPPTVEMQVGGTQQFTARGYHASGIELWFLPRWSATGGSITRDGLYSVGAAPGDYTVTACRSYDVCGTAQVKVVP